MANPKRPLASALRYNADNPEAPPRLLASGKGMTAERIIEMAREAGVPVREEPMLAEALSQLEVGTDVPADLYVAVAEVLVWAWRVDRRDSRSPQARLGG